MRAETIDGTAHAVFLHAFLTTKIVDSSLVPSSTILCSKAIIGMAPVAHRRSSLSNSRRSQSLLGSIQSTASQSGGALG